MVRERPLNGKGLRAYGPQGSKRRRQLFVGWVIFRPPHTIGNPTRFQRGFGDYLEKFLK
jgi:hypothetical protein